MPELLSTRPRPSAKSRRVVFCPYNVRCNEEAYLGHATVREYLVLVRLRPSVLMKKQDVYVRCEIDD